MYSFILVRICVGSKTVGMRQSILTDLLILLYLALPRLFDNFAPWTLNEVLQMYSVISWQTLLRGCVFVWCINVHFFTKSWNLAKITSYNISFPLQHQVCSAKWTKVHYLFFGLNLHLFFHFKQIHDHKNNLTNSYTGKC